MLQSFFVDFFSFYTYEPSLSTSVFIWMALRMKLNTNDEGETNELDDLDELDAVYVNKLKESSIQEDLLEQFKDITKLLDEQKGKS